MLKSSASSALMPFPISNRRGRINNDSLKLFGGNNIRAEDAEDFNIANEDALPF